MENMNPEEILELQKKNCIFCKIISKEIPSQEIYLDDKVTVILDINPANEGHCLILPKEHYQILPQIPDDLMSYLFVKAKQTSRILLKALGIKGTTVFVANGALAGQKAPHFMIHVIPRKPNDMLFELTKKKINATVLKEVQSKLVARLSGKMPQITHQEEQKSPQPEEPSKEPQKEPTKKHENSQEAKEKQDVNLDDISKLFS